VQPDPPVILIVDDSSDQRHLLRVICEHRGAKVDEASDGKTAIEIAHELQPDLVVLDLVMPVMGGLDALPHIREVSPNSRIVILSSLPREKMEEHTRAQGAVGYVEKSTSPDRLFDEIMVAANVLEIAHEILNRGIELVGTVEAPRTARRFIEETLHSQEDEAFVEKIQLLISEVVTNAVEYSQQEIHVEVFIQPSSIRVEVTDKSTDLPKLRIPEADSPTGRGLMIVSSVADRWGVNTFDEGKTVWFELNRSRANSKSYEEV
jgi:CheY-like chemotaxis protein